MSTERIGHTALAVLEGRRAFTKGGLKDHGEEPKGESFLEGVNRLILKEDGVPVTHTEYANALAGEEASPDNLALARLVASKANLSVKRTLTLLQEINKRKDFAGLFKRPDKPIESPYDPQDPRVFAAALGRKLREQAKRSMPTES